MKVLVAGATGAIGRPLISALVSARHNVFGMTSSKLGLQTLKEDGAEGLLASALDAQAVDAAIKRARPEVVIDELTSLPKHYTPDEMRAAAERDHKLRLEGGQNVLNAARAAGARRYIIQSLAPISVTRIAIGAILRWTFPSRGALRAYPDPLK